MKQYCNLITNHEDNMSMVELVQYAQNLSTSKELYRRLIGNGWNVEARHMVHITCLLFVECIYLTISDIK